MFLIYLPDAVILFPLHGTGDGNAGADLAVVRVIKKRNWCQNLQGDRDRPGPPISTTREYNYYDKIEDENGEVRMGDTGAPVLWK